MILQELRALNGMHPTVERALLLLLFTISPRFREFSLTLQNLVERYCHETTENTFIHNAEEASFVNDKRRKNRP